MSIPRSRVFQDQQRRAKNHARAARAFHIGLIAETHRHLHALRALDRHIDVLRHAERMPDQKLAAAHAACRELKHLEDLKGPWRDTYRDFRQTLIQLRRLLSSIAKTTRRTHA